MSRTSPSQWLATLTLAFVACAASASPIQGVQYEVYNDQQSAPREPASDLQTVSNQQTPAELQSHGAQQHSDQPSSEEKSEQAAAPSSTPEQPNAFVSERSGEPRDVAQAEPQSSEQPNAEGLQELKSSEPPQSQPAAPSTETKSGEDYDPYNP